LSQQQNTVEGPDKMELQHTTKVRKDRREHLEGTVFLLSTTLTLHFTLYKDDTYLQSLKFY